MILLYICFGVVPGWLYCSFGVASVFFAGPLMRSSVAIELLLCARTLVLVLMCVCMCILPPVGYATVVRKQESTRPESWRRNEAVRKQ